MSERDEALDPGLRRGDDMTVLPPPASRLPAVPWPLILPQYVDTWAEDTSPERVWRFGMAEPRTMQHADVTMTLSAPEQGDRLLEFFDGPLAGGAQPFVFTHPTELEAIEFWCTDRPHIDGATVTMRWAWMVQPGDEP